MNGLVTGSQLRAGRALAGLTQRGLGAALGVDERQVRFWERRIPAQLRKRAAIERAFADRGVVFFSAPVIGVGLVSDTQRETSSHG